MRKWILTLILGGVVYTPVASAIGFCSQSLAERAAIRQMSEAEREGLIKKIPALAVPSFSKHLDHIIHLVGKEAINASELMHVSLLQAKDPHSGKRFFVLRLPTRYLYFANSAIHGLGSTEGLAFGLLRTAAFSFAQPVELRFVLSNGAELFVGTRGVREHYHPSRSSAAEFYKVLASKQFSGFHQEFLQLHKESLYRLYNSSQNGVAADLLMHLRKAVFLESGKEYFFVDSPKTKWLFDIEASADNTSLGAYRLQDFDFQSHGSMVVIGEGKTYSLKPSLGFVYKQKLVDREALGGEYIQATGYSLQRALGRKLTQQHLNLILGPRLIQYPQAQAFYPSWRLPRSQLESLYEKYREHFNERELEILFTHGYLGFFMPTPG